MKQFILKNIVLVAILAITLVGSIFLIFFIWSKQQTIQQSMKDIEADVAKVEAINSARNPNSVEQSEKMIKADTETMAKKNVQIYRHFGKPYRPALLKLLKNIASPAELEADLPLDPTLVAKPKPKIEAEESDDDEDSDAEETASAAPAAPTDEEKAVFNPETSLVILSFEEDQLRTMLADLYKEVHQESNEDTFVIPDTVQAERAQLFDKLFNQIIEAPEVVDSSRSEDFRKAAAAKFAKAFAIFREDVQALTLEDVTDKVAHELFLDALGLPRLMRQRDCKNYIDSLYEKYLNSDLIPGISSGDTSFSSTNRVQEFIYGKNLNRQALPVAEMVIPIIRNFQIKEDLFRRMKDSGIDVLRSMNAGVFYGTTLDNDPEGPILEFTYTLEMTASMEAIDTFINSLHAAYKSDRVYVIKNIKFTAPYDDLIEANTLVNRHSKSSSETNPVETTAGTAANQAQSDAASTDDGETQAAVVVSYTPQYELTDPRNSDYGRMLIGGKQDKINCTIVVNYLFYRADNITPQ